MMLVYMMLES